jgi:Spy/CpxP family protein refolding chaperone
MAKVIVIIGFIVSFAAGLIVGIGTRQTSIASPAATRPSDRGSWLTSELNLSPTQRDELKKIWSETASHGWRDQEDRRRQLRREREEAIAALVKADDKARLEAISKNYSDQLAAMEHESRTAFQDAVKRTKEVLTAEQRTKYEELLQRHQWDRGGRDRESTRQTTRSTRQGDVSATSLPVSKP